MSITHSLEDFPAHTLLQSHVWVGVSPIRYSNPLVLTLWHVTFSPHHPLRDSTLIFVSKQIAQYLTVTVKKYFLFKYTNNFKMKGGTKHNPCISFTSETESSQ